jgi:uncharacterized repeat protein (TIGR01451 family)
MKRFMGLVSIRPILAAIAAVGPSGCASEQPHKDPRYELGGRSEMSSPAPAPAKPVEAARPAAAPAARPVAEPRPGTTVMYLPTGERGTSALMIEKIHPSEVIAGSTFDYEIRVTNLTSGGLSAVSVTDSAPTNFKVASTSPTATISGQNLVFNLGDIPARESRTIKISGQATGAGAVASCCSATWSNALCMSIAVTQPALKVAKTAPAEVTVCDAIPVKITVTNSGTGMARNVTVKDVFPAGLTTADGRSEVTLDAGTLAAGQSRDFNLSLKAARTGTYANKATASADGGLAAESTQTSTVVRQPVLTITKTGPERVFIGRPATYEITVTNTGDAPANNTVVEDVITGGTFVSASDGGTASGGRVTWRLGSLAPKASRKLTLQLACSGAAGPMTNAATARADCAAAVSASVRTECAGIPALLLDGVDDPDPIQVGDNTTYTLTVTNQGSAPLTNVRLTCTMDEGDTMQYVSSTGPGQANVQGRAITFPPVGRIEPKQSVTYRIVIKAVKEGQVSFRAEASSAEITRPLVKIETTNFYK